MIYGFVRQSDGHLSVQSEPGKGTTFRLYLPREAERRPQAVPAIAPAAVVGGNESILLVEDNAQLRQTVAAQIADLGYQLHVAEDAESALAIMARERQLDLMFTDVVMAGSMDGIALAEQAQLLRPGLKVLLTSGFPDVRDASRRIAGGSLKILDKPYSRGELASALRCLLDPAPDGRQGKVGGAVPAPPNPPSFMKTTPH